MTNNIEVNGVVDQVIDEVIEDTVAERAEEAVEKLNVDLHQDLALNIERPSTWGGVVSTLVFGGKIHIYAFDNLVATGTIITLAERLEGVKFYLHDGVLYVADEVPTEGELNLEVV